ncbi:DUF4158 domain-containing protein [Streptacidiphilus sp. P02-A3a]|uniref:DUF4158 domain-containing protein n=1 Tax=Streptacidiphilus sp. P02-A3a TaxID=2704468 RepID=UPI0015F7961D|nr:DUF4158 domain-containing protein [Streptacidiphilus sp. P02-A3a]QMU69369.1 DUF4158 domain-containing protein [Streptacidiphilus sp. P02-A3a]
MTSIERTDSNEHQLALLLMLKPFYASEKTAKNHRTLVRQRAGVRYDGKRARELARETIRAEAASKNNPADLINVALEKLVEGGLELPAFSTLDHMASTVRAEVNTGICSGIWECVGEDRRAGLLRLLDLDVLVPGAKSPFNRLKQHAQRATWSHFKDQMNQLAWVDELGDTALWLDGVASGKVTDFAGEAAAADAGVLRDYAVVKRVAVMACLAHKARMRARDDLATHVLQAHGHQGQEVPGRAGGDPQAPAGHRGGAGGELPHPAAAGRRGRSRPGGPGQGSRPHPGRTEGPGRPLLYGHLQRDRAVMFELTDKLELTATSEDSRVLDALAHAKRHRTSRDYIPVLDEAGKPVDTSFATQNWQKIIRDRSRPGSFVRRHFEAMVFCNLADELRTGDVAVVGSEEYADWSEQLLPWAEVEAKLPAYLVEVGLREEGDESLFGAAEFRAQLETMLTGAAAAADSGYPENEDLFIDPATGVPTLNRRKRDDPRASAKKLEQAIRSRMPERSLMGIVARTAYSGRSGVGRSQPGPVRPGTCRTKRGAGGRANVCAGLGSRRTWSSGCPRQTLGARCMCAAQWDGATRPNS